MIFEFNDKKYFYFHDKFTQTDDKGHYELDKDDYEKILKDLGKSNEDEKTAYAFVYQFLINHETLTFETFVKRSGNSARIPIPPKYLEKHVKVWVAFLNNK